MVGGRRGRGYRIEIDKRKEDGDKGVTHKDRQRETHTHRHRMREAHAKRESDMAWHGADHDFVSIERTTVCKCFRAYKGLASQLNALACRLCLSREDASHYLHYITHATLEEGLPSTHRLPM